MAYKRAPAGALSIGTNDVMSRVAVFVDAGYFLAQGWVAIWGVKQSRAALDLNESAAVAEITSLAQTKAPNAELLRIYWYDGVGSRGPTLEQLRLARLDNVKIRLGFINSKGQQKGVDSLIVTDLVDLARNGAISDAILVSGDEDVRIAVQIAQSFGVRVHLAGIVPSRGSQSRQLIDEADTTFEWNKATMATMITMRAAAPAPVSTPASATVSLPTTANVALDSHVDIFFTTLNATDIAGIKAYWTTGQTGIPREFDGKLLATARTALGRSLSESEKRSSRTRLSVAIRAIP